MKDQRSAVSGISSLENLTGMSAEWHDFILMRYLLIVDLESPRGPE